MSKDLQRVVMIVKANALYDQLIDMLDSDLAKMAQRLHELCMQLPNVKLAVQDKKLSAKDRAQAWQYYLAFVKVLKECDWWDKDEHQPKDWIRFYEHPSRNTTGN